jgi:hypothetical protein
MGTFYLWVAGDLGATGDWLVDGRVDGLMGLC